ncbi:MAG: hypothetical protein LBK68_00775 [Candidatus Margulisbacteria bacterium]|nr:hypothetical protein [Candidatus Margulisiibacteriota bacterium]
MEVAIMNKWLTKILSDEELLRRVRMGGGSKPPRKPWPPLAKAGIAVAGLGAVGVAGYQCEAAKESRRSEVEPAEATEALEQETAESETTSIHDEGMKILNEALEKTDLKNEENLNIKIQTTLDNVMRGDNGNKLKVTLGDAIFIQDPSQPQNGIVSESVYFLRIAAAKPSEETQKFFDGLLRGFDQMTALGGGHGVFPAWTVKIENDRLVLNTDKDAGAHNSAADSDHDLIMALLVAVQNVKNNDWEDSDYAERLEKLIDGLAKEYIEVAGRWALKPSEDWYGDEQGEWFYLDYFSPETCFALAQYLAAKNDPRAAFWQKCGEDSLEIYAACLEQIGWVPEQVSLGIDEDGNLLVEARQGHGLQGWDGIRAPSRIAAGLPYYIKANKLTEEQKAIFTEYLNKWNDPAGKASGMAPALTAAAYLPLAVQLGAVDLAAEMLSVLAKENTAAVYASQDQYYETSLILKALVDVSAPYDLDKYSRMGDYTPAWRLEDICDPQAGYYGQVGVLSAFGALGFVINPDPPSQFKIYKGINTHIITAESMLSGLADAMAAGDMAKFQAIFNMIDALCVENYNKGKAKRLFLPRVVTLKPQDSARKLSLDNFTIPGGNDGKASSSGADLMLLALLIKALDMDFNTGLMNAPKFLYDAQNRIRNFIARYASEMVKSSGDVYPYTDETGATRLLLTPGGLIGSNESPRDQSIIYEYHTDYVQNLDILRCIVQYFRPGFGIGNSKGSSELYTIFTALLSDTEELKKRIDAKFSDAVKYPQGMPQTVYIYLPHASGQPVRVLDANEFSAEMNPNKKEEYISLNYPGSNGYDYGYYYTQIMQAASSGKQPAIDFKQTKAQVNVNEDYIYGKTGIGVVANHVARHHGVAGISPLHDRRLQNDSEIGRGRLQTADSKAYDRTPYPFAVSIPILFFNIDIIGDWEKVFSDRLRAALRRMSEADYAAQGEQMYTNTLLAYAGLPTAKMVKKGMTTERVAITAIRVDDFLESVLGFSEEFVRKGLYIEISAVDVVSYYLLQISAMFGYDKPELLHRINMLLAEIERQAQTKGKEVDLDNPIVKALKLQQLLLWNNMSPLQRDRLDLADLEHYGLRPLYNYFKDQPATQNDIIKLTEFSWDGIELDVSDAIVDPVTGEKEYTLTPDKLKKMRIPQQLKDVVFSEIARRDILEKIKKYPLPVPLEREKEREENLREELFDYIDNLPKEYKVPGLIPILFSEGELDENDERKPDPIPRAIKEEFIRTYLDEIDYTKAGASGKYNTLWQAYTLLLYKEVSKEISDWVKKVKADESDQPNAKTLLLIKQKLANLTAMLNIMHLTGLPLEQQSTDPLIEQFAKAREINDKAFDDFVGTYEEQGILADIFNNIYWLGNDLEQLKDAKEDGSLYRQRGFDLLNVYTTNNADWENSDKLNGVYMRLHLQESARNKELTPEQITENLNKLRQRQRAANAYGNKREYAYFLQTEAFVYSQVGYNPQPDERNENPENGYSRYRDIVTDEILKQFDYILAEVKNMQMDVESINPPPLSPVSADDSQENNPTDTHEDRTEETNIDDARNIFGF